MIAAALIAASILAPAGTTTIQGAPVCLPSPAQPGHSYPLSVSVSGSGPLTLSVVPDTGGLHASLRQVPASWVTFAANPASPGSVAFTLTIPGNADPGAYWSNIEAGTGGQPQSGSGVTVTNRTAATTGLVFTVGPSSTPPPPCDALSLAQSTGKYPPWPSEKFKTASWKQVYARDKGPVTPDGGPTAGTGTPAHPGAAPAYSPAASQGSAGPNRDAWEVFAIITALVVLVIMIGRR